MTGVQLDTVLRQLRHVVEREAFADLPDRQLLDRFARGREEAAFAMLVRRHGPLVLGVCQRVLGHAQDAEDAFQATFLVLARRAASIRKGASVGSWLHGVAYRVAAKARAQAGRRRTRERQAGEMRNADAGAETSWQELAPVLDEELQRLPEKYRVPLILCYWQGKTHKAAARELGCPAGTLSWRLVQARDLLRARLQRRGVLLSSALLAALLVQEASALVPAPLLTATVKAGLWFAAGRGAAAGVVSTKVALLAEGVVRSMALTKLKIATALLLALGVLGTGAGVVMPPAAAELPGNVNAEASPAAAGPKAEKSDLFVDVTAQSGVDFTYRNGEEADHLTILESLGGGVALLDYDNDGLLDLVIIGGGTFGGDDRKQILGRGNRLYKNLGGCKFRDVTKEVGLDGPSFYGHGAAVVDYDLDGWPDLLITGYGRLALYHNEPDGKGGRRFVDVTKKAGLPEGLWTTSAAWADLDGDGYPDLYLCQYVNWSFANHPQLKDIAPPKMFQGLPHKLFRNNRDGTFTDVSKEARLQDSGKGLGVVIVDVNDDGKPDIFVANDTVDKFLYLNRSTPGKLLFEEVGLASGVARDDRGTPNGSRGVDVGDFDGNGLPSIFVANYERELHALYRNALRGGQPIFVFDSHRAGIAAIGQGYVGWGTAFLDVDNDGWEDLIIINGHDLRRPGFGARHQRPVLLLNLGNGKFIDISAKAGKAFQIPQLGRGVAVADLDNDGRPDLIISRLNQPVIILRNQSAARNHWLGIELVGRGHRDVVGAKVVVEADGRRLTRFAKGGGSYLSSSDRRLIFGLGQADRVDKVTVFWPNGKKQQWDGERFQTDRYWRLAEGKDQPKARK
jgi:RNA polymerase sigma factor (sigma-70 family)